ncbi:MAG: LamG-like jellyroll fold domain-containing protein, partial [Bacteroidota bacterium]|nr:LamG-like jellyroll fold domain-containing protein [Bacteroidota bacterium]
MIVFISLIITFKIKAQNQGCLKVGTNFSYGFGENPYLNELWTTNNWGTPNNLNKNAIPSDSNGYPLQIPFVPLLPNYNLTSGATNITSVQSGVYRMLFGQYNYGASPPAGTIADPWVIVWDGIGTIQLVSCCVNRVDLGSSYNSGCTVNILSYTTFSGGGGRMTFTVPSPGCVVTLNIPYSKLGNHVRNMRQYRLSNEALYNSGERFNPKFLSALSPFHTARWMMWTATNYFSYPSWSDRTTKDYYCQQGANDENAGISHDNIIEISNRTKVRPWINIPYAADDDYITKCALRYKTYLDQDLEMYIEYGNEQWNFGNGYLTFNHLNNTRSVQLFGATGFYNETGAERELNMFKIFRRVFGKDSLRVKRISMTGNQSGNTHTNLMPKGSFDYLSWNWYFGLDNSNQTTYRNSLINAVNSNNVAAACNAYTQCLRDKQLYTGFWDEYRAYAKAYGVKMACYEGGLSGSSFDPMPANVRTFMRDVVRHDVRWKAVINEILDTLQSWNVEMPQHFVLGNADEWGSVDDVNNIQANDYTWHTYKEWNDNKRLSCPPPVVSNNIGSGNSFMFNGSNTYIDNTGSLFINEGADYTIETWVKFNQIAQDQVIWSYSGLTASNLLKMDNQSRVHWIIKNDVGSTALDLQGMGNSALLQLNKWVHLTAVKSGLMYKVYANGVEVGSSLITGGGTFTYNKASIGTLLQPSFTGISMLSGEVDEYRRYNSALNAVTIRDWMCKKATSNHPNWANLQSYFTFNTVAGSNLIDGKSGAAVGTHNNFSTNSLSNYIQSGFVTSGAPIGDDSRNLYPALWSGSTLSYTHPQGDRLSVTNMGNGAPDGVHIYMVNQGPYLNQAPNNYISMANNRYYGVFMANGTDPLYDIAYDYTGNTYPSSNMAFNRLIKRQNGSDKNWVNSGALANKFIKRLTLNCRESYRAEYTIGIRQTNQTSRPGAGLALQLNSGTNQVNISPAPPLYGDFTISAWVKGNDNVIVLSDGGYGAYGLGLGVSGNADYLQAGFRFTTNANGYTVRNSGYFNPYPVSSANDDWSHITYIRTGNTLSTYVNGQFNNSNTLPANTPFLTMNIGAGFYGNNFNGLIDELSVWDVAMPVDLVRSYMCKKITSSHPYYCTNLKMYYDFEDVSNNVFEDKFGKYDGILTGGTLVNSGAPVGDYSTYKEVDKNIFLTNGDKVTLKGPEGDSLSITITAGNYMAGLHLYYVNGKSNGTVPASPTVTGQDSSRYWGSFIVKNYGLDWPGLTGSLKQTNYAVSLEYNYNKNSYVNQTQESSLLMLRRNKSNITTWTVTPSVTLNTGQKKLTWARNYAALFVNYGDPLRDEYLLGGNSVSNNNFIFNNTVPGQPAMPSGPTLICAGASGIKYSIPSISGASMYLWTLPSGLSGTSDSSSIVVQAGAAGVGKIYVAAMNAWGKVGLPSLPLNVTITGTDYLAYDISGPINPCQNSTVTYSVPGLSGVIGGYTWTLPTDAAVIGINNTNVVSVKFGLQNGKVNVSGNYACGNSLINSKSISVAPVPDANLAVIGNVFCKYTDFGRVTIPVSQIGILYQAKIGTTIVGTPITAVDNNGVEIQIPISQLTAGLNTITVEALSGSCAPTTLNTKAIIIMQDYPIDQGTAGNATICQNSPAVVTISNTQAGTVYSPWYYNTNIGAWITGYVGKGSAVMSPSNGANIQLTLSQNTYIQHNFNGSYQYHVKAETACGAIYITSKGTINITNSTVNAGAPSSVTGTSNVCNFSNPTYAQNGIVGDIYYSQANNASSYTWQISNTAALDPGQLVYNNSPATGPYAIAVWNPWFTGNVTLSVRANSNCGASSSFVTKNVVVDISPVINTVLITQPGTCASNTGKVQLNIAPIPTGQFSSVSVNGNYDLDLNGDGVFEFTNVNVVDGTAILNVSSGQVVYNVRIRKTGGACISAVFPINIPIVSPAGPQIVSVSALNPSSCGANNGIIILTLQNTITGTLDADMNNDGVFEKTGIVVSNSKFVTVSGYDCGQSVFSPKIRATSCISNTYTYSYTFPNGFNITSALSGSACSGQPYNYTIASNGSGALNYAWSRPSILGISNSAIPYQSGSVIGENLSNVTGSVVTVTYTLFAAQGLTSITSTLKVAVNPIPSINISGPSTLCGGSVSLTASGANTYNWMPGNLSGAIQSLSPGSTTTYSVSGINASGCSGVGYYTLTF